MDFRILGPLEVLEGERALDIGGHKQSAVLAMLLLAANRPVSRDALIDALWQEDPPETAQKALQVYVSRLRKLLGRERVETRPPGYLLHVEPGELDLARFERLRADGRPEEALALWRGPPLAEFGREPFARAEIGRLEEMRLACLEERVDRDLARGAHAALASELEGLVNEHPLRESLRAQLMICLYRSGRQADALAAFAEARRTLVDELGIEPGRRLRELHQQILEQDPGLDLQTAAAAATREPAAAFVGRAAELAELTSGLEDAFAGRGRLFLLGGEPGIGKSRLAEELVAAAAARGARVLVGRCWEAGGARRSGRGCRRCAAASTRRGPAPAPARMISRSSCPPRGRRRTSPKPRGSGCSTRPRSSCGARRRTGPSSSSSTTCTPPTLRRSCSCSSSRASSPPPVSWCSAPTATSIPCPDRRWWRCWRSSAASRSRAVSSSAG
jgi:DNA-binding SARP family transcriptional activator